MQFIDKLKKIELLPNSKIPKFKGWNLDTNLKTDIHIGDTNYGIITGEQNNIFIVDVDIKKSDSLLNSGTGEIENYKKLIKSDIFNTLTIKTPSDGTHYYYKFSSNDKYLNELLTHIKTTTHIRNSTIDIRANGGYIVGPGSKINDIPYTILNEIEPIEPDEPFLLWLLENNLNIQSKKPNKPNLTDKHDIYIRDEHFNISIHKFKYLLHLLPIQYANTYAQWLKILSISKSLNTQFPTYDIFDIWSNTGTNYDTNNNKDIWDKNNTYLNINLLIHLLNKELNLNLSICTQYKPLPKPIFNIETIQINSRYMEYDYKIFETYSTILLNSTCGTGKTSNTAYFISKYLNSNPTYKFLSLTNLIKLSEQQIKSFTDNKLNVLNYQNVDKYQNVNNFICCINSINKKLSIPDSELSNCICYIDEITSFIDTLLFSDTLNIELKATYKKLVKLITHAHKVILSDAHILSNIQPILNLRDKNKTILIQNNYKKFKNIIVNKYLDENEFLNKLLTHIKTDNYFLFGCDSRKELKQKYLFSLDANPDKKDKFILITSSDNFNITNANDQFKNKFVFYSPSITTGISFELDIKQDVFLYMRGNTITPLLSFQQICRTRNINQVYLYSKASVKKAKYKSADELAINYKNLIITNDKINNLCLSNADNEDIINENLFFKLYIETEYIQDIFNTNKTAHLEQILFNEGFIINEIGYKQNLLKETKKKMGSLYENIDGEFFNNYIKAIRNNSVFNNNKFNFIEEQRNKLYIPVEELNLYKDILTDSYFYQSFKRFEALFLTEPTIKFYLDHNDATNMKIKNLKPYLNKIKLIREYEKITGLKPFQITKDDNKLNTIDDDMYKLLKKVFEITKIKPLNGYDIIKFYVGMLKNICGDITIISSKKTKIKQKNNWVNITKYSFNYDIISKYTKCFKKLSKYTKYDETLLKIFNIKLDTLDMDNNDFCNDYLFGKKY